jgi:hypothetical protein
LKTKTIFRYLLLTSITLFFTACSYKNKTILDTQKYSQNPTSYTKNLKVENINQDSLKDEFIKNYYFVWDLEKLSYTKKESSWGNIYAKKEVYLENHIKASKQWFNKQIENSNFEEFNKVSQKAILTRNSDFRVFPTANKMFYDPKKAGEGYPFDYNQNSRVKINTPVLVSHYSKDKAWAFVQSHFVLGWVRVDKLLFVTNDQEEQFRRDNLYVIIKEGFEVFSKTNLEDLKVGTFFPKKDGKYLLATTQGIEKIDINDYKIKKLPLEFNSKNIETLAKEFIGELYGWGGSNNHRDCSSFTQDFFSPFAIYLKRNSKSQTELHKYIDLSKMSNNSKKQYIIKNGIPFLTLVYLRGHIMLYVGSKDNEALVMHNVWGVRTKDIWGKSGRNIIGKTVITTLEPGIELFNADKTKTILQKVQGIVLLNQKVAKD